MFTIWRNIAFMFKFLYYKMTDDFFVYLSGFIFLPISYQKFCFSYSLYSSLTLFNMQIFTRKLTRIAQMNDFLENLNQPQSSWFGISSHILNTNSQAAYINKLTYANRRVGGKICSSRTMSVSSNGKISKIYVCVNFHLRCKYVLHLLFAHTVLNAIIVGIIVTTVLAGWLNIPKNCRTGKAIKPMTCKQRKVLIIYLHKYSYIYLHAFSCIALASFKQIYLIKVRQVDTLHRCQCEALI